MASSHQDKRERAQPTPGPWEFYENKESTLYIVRQPNEGQFVADCNMSRPAQAEWPSPEVAEANARLIAAAPDLLNACLNAEAWLQSWASAEPYLTAIRAAIKKARGE